MGKRTMINADLPLAQFRVQFLLSAFFVFGGLIGVLFLRFLAPAEGASLCGYLSDYLKLVGHGGSYGSWWSFLWEGLRLYLAILIFGFAVWGMVGLPVLFLERGFFLAFGSACFWRVYGVRGLIPSFVLFGIPALLWAPVLFLMGTSGLIRAQNLLHGTSVRDSFFLRRSLACLCLVFAWILAECFVVPVLLRRVVSVLSFT